MVGAEPVREGGEEIVVRAALGVRRHDRAPDLQVGVGAGGVEVVML